PGRAAPGRPGTGRRSGAEPAGSGRPDGPRSAGDRPRRRAGARPVRFLRQAAARGRALPRPRGRRGRRSARAGASGGGIRRRGRAARELRAAGQQHGGARALGRPRRRPGARAGAAQRRPGARVAGRRRASPRDARRAGRRHAGAQPQRRGRSPAGRPEPRDGASRAGARRSRRRGGLDRALTRRGPRPLARSARVRRTGRRPHGPHGPGTPLAAPEARGVATGGPSDRDPAARGRSDVSPGRAEARERIEAGRRRGAGPAEPARRPGARATGGGPRCRPAWRARLTPGRHAGRRAPPDRREGSRSMATRPRAGSKPSLPDRWAGTGAIGYKLSSEEFEPRELVRQAARAEESGFGFAMISDHFHPWTDRQGQSPFVWATLGGIAQATERLTVSTGVTCPLLRIHPAIVAQAAATVAAMMPGRFGLGVGAGENLNEHVAGAKWPPTDVRHEMLKEAVTVIRRLWEGGLQDFRGRHYQVDNARLYTLPEAPPPILVAASGPKAAELAGRIGDGLVTTEPDAGLAGTFRRGGAGARPSGPPPAGRRPPPSPGALSTRRGRAATHPQPASLAIEWY